MLQVSHTLLMGRLGLEKKVVDPYTVSR